MRYKQDLTKFLSIADGARLIQERAGITEDEAREDIVLVLRDGEAYFQFWHLGRDGRIWCHPRYLPHGFLDNLTPNDIDWEKSIARRRRVGSPFTVEIEVSRKSLDWLWPENIEVDDRVRRALSQAGKEPKDEAAGADAPGRPSLKTEIENACNKLIANKKAILGSRTRNYEPIRKIICRERDLPSKAYINGLGDEAIRKVIAPILDEAKAASHKLSHKLSQKL